MCKGRVYPGSAGQGLICTFLVSSLLFMQLFLKMLSGMANSVDPDQTAQV